VRKTSSTLTLAPVVAAAAGAVISAWRGGLALEVDFFFIRVGMDLMTALLLLSLLLLLCWLFVGLLR
jgi:hypothetical protein